MNDLAHWLGVAVLVIGVPLNAVVVYFQRKESRAHPRLRVLQERLVAGLCVLAFAFVFGPIFVYNDLPQPPIIIDTRLITRAVADVIVFIPALLWLFLYRRGGHDE